MKEGYGVYDLRPQELRIPQRKHLATKTTFYLSLRLSVAFNLLFQRLHSTFLTMFRVEGRPQAHLSHIA